MKLMNIIEIINRIIEYINAYIWLGIPNVVKGLICALVFVVIFKKQIKAHPVVFYIYPALYFIWDLIACSTFLSSAAAETLEGWGWSGYLMAGWWLEWLGLGTTFGIGLIIIVMFIGVLPKTEFVKNLFTIRTEMSIIGGTILVGHGILQQDNIILYNQYYSDSPIFFTLIMFCILGMVILLLLIAPWITSFRAVRKKMKPSTWKKLQTYTSIPLFVGMLLFGLAMYLGRVLQWYPGIVDIWNITTPLSSDEPMSLGYGVDLATYYLSAKVYLVFLVAYIVLRIKKFKGKKQPVAAEEAPAPEGAGQVRV
jgi:DMSO/TMAO reductase YedYZ heme-binding membrane subunit